MSITPKSKSHLSEGAVAVSGNGQVLVDKVSRDPIAVGDVVTSFRGERATVTGGTPASGHSTGRVNVQWEGSDWQQEFYPSVFDLEWVTIASQQAPKA